MPMNKFLVLQLFVKFSAYGRSVCRNGCCASSYFVFNRSHMGREWGIVLQCFDTLWVS